MTGGIGPLAFGSIVSAGVVVVLSGAVFLAFLPSPRAAQSITLPSSLTSYLPLRDPTGVTGSGSQSTEPAQAGKASGKIGVGGYLGFASELDTAIRGALGNEVVMRVRADRPGYFLGMTFDTWDGENWKRSPGTSKLTQLSTGSPFQVGTALSSFAQPQDQPSALPWSANDYGSTNVQTFYVAEPIANLLFATPDPSDVYFPEHSLIIGADGSMRSTIAMNPGTVYTVISADTTLSQATLAKLRTPQSSQNQPALAPDLALPSGRYARVAALARHIVTTAHATTTYEEVTALEAWMGRHVKYSTDIPPLLPGQDAVNQFLFGTRVGYCEQISTALAVMLRTLGVPTREAIGYVPGPFDPLSDLYEIQAKDAHAWVQVWFPGVGWQNFDPTAQVPLAPPDPGAVMLSDIGHVLGRLPWAPIGFAGGALAVGALAVAVLAHLRRRPRQWPERLTIELERRGAAAGLRRWPAETLGEYAARLGAFGQWRAGASSAACLRSTTNVLQQAAYGDHEPDNATKNFVEDVVRGLHPTRRARRPARGRRLTTA